MNTKTVNKQAFNEFIQKEANRSGKSKESVLFELAKQSLVSYSLVSKVVYSSKIPSERVQSMLAHSIGLKVNEVFPYRKTSS